MSESLFWGSSAVEQAAVNRQVAGSNPVPRASHIGEPKIAEQDNC